MDRVTISGLRPILRKFGKLAPAVQRRVARQAMTGAQEIMANTVKANAPVLTGQTRAAVKVAQGKGRKGKVNVNVTVSKKDFASKTYYAAATEYGTHHQHPQHYMKHSFDAAAPRVLHVGMMAMLVGLNQVVKTL